MKTQILIFLVSLFTVGGFAASNPAILTDKAKMLLIQTGQWNSEKVNVQIKDESGTLVLDETVKNAKSARRYNLKNLPNGMYTLEMSNELKITVQNFKIDGSEVLVSNEVKTSFKPVINWNNKNLDVNLLTLGKQASLNIYDDSNNIIFSEILDDNVVNKRYNISKLSSGDYTVNMIVDGRSYYKTITK
ncbi:MAG: hypothetical protein IPO92_02235 [Saprospiraceae bacterium]|nr:hypothetical protein [Saprospiraceae bacterium]